MGRLRVGKENLVNRFLSGLARNVFIYCDNYCLPTVAGGRSRLHILDLGSCGRGKDNVVGGPSAGSTTLSLSALGTVISALLSGQRQLPHRLVECKLIFKNRK
jgi:hypothetical protein